MKTTKKQQRVIDLTNSISLFLDESQKQALKQNIEKFSEFNLEKLIEKLEETQLLEEKYLEKIKKNDPQIFEKIDKKIDTSKLLKQERQTLDELKLEILDLKKLADNNK